MTLRPDLIIVSSGGVMSLETVELALSTGIPVATISQAHSEHDWPTDDLANRWRNAWLSSAQCYFVSHANLQLVETQIACDLPNATVVANPIQVPRDHQPCWPEDPPESDYQLANVARLHPPSKGQDILLKTLSIPKWRERPIHVNIYGSGPMEGTLKMLTEVYELCSRVTFHGHVQNVSEIWRQNHLLLLPSRYEGLPLALVEAMLCGRPAVVTDVAGNGEVVTDEVTGFLADAPTVKLFDRALESAWNRREDWQQMGRLARDAALEYLPKQPADLFASHLANLVISHSNARS
ncbi:glycosyltransferase [Novipirellula galeiformis]|uniref:glycosyltransferase n=1 Tax=Novipirellula galeiformis TaxID=2528004 RepID=UPI0018CE822E|nr:glycosyltransferase [Novipirellula galeiformis]